MDDNLEMFAAVPERKLSHCPHCGGDLLHVLGGTICDTCDFRASEKSRTVTQVPLAHFDGETYEPEYDLVRLSGQNQRVYELMTDGEWRTLREIADQTGDPEASISARLRDLRKEKFGGYTVERRRRGDESKGLFEYRIAE